MEPTRHLSLLALAALALLALYGREASACMCEHSHPQTHYCTADYVVLVRVLRKSNTIEPGKTIYKVHIKRIYKATPEARHMLRDGRLSSASEDFSCGVQLDIGKVYVLAGRMPQLNLCSYYKEYTRMTVIERHGFSRTYAYACSCKVTPCYGMQCLRRTEYADSCKWSPFGKCEREYSSCVPHKARTRNGEVQRCRWRRTQHYKKCLSYP